MEQVVSIIITTFNRREYLKRALTSALNQTYNALEILVIDDASSDGTHLVMADYLSEHSNIKYFRNTENKGSNYCRNYGIKESSGHYIAGLDDDDVFHPQRIERLVQYYSDQFAFITSLNERVINGDVHYSACKEVVTLDDLLMSNCLMNQGLIERERMLSEGLYDESLTACQDYDMWLRLCDAFGNVKVVQEYLQTIYESGDIQRISNNGHKTFIGYLGFYRKYKSKFSTLQKQNMLFTIYRVRNKALAFWSFKSLLSKENENNLIKYYKNNNSALCDYFSIQNVTNKIEALDKKRSYILYGYGSLGKIAHLYLQGSIVAVIDEGLLQKGVDLVSGTRVISLQELSRNRELAKLTILISPINHIEEIKLSLESLHLNFAEII